MLIPGEEEQSTAGALLKLTLFACVFACGGVFSHQLTLPP